MFDDLREWDRQAFIYLNSLGIEEYDSFWSIITEISTWTPLFIFIIVFFFIKFPRHQAINRVIVVVFLVVFIMLLTMVVKEWVARLRPNNNEDINSLIRILKSPTDYSFFSGHASSSFAVATIVYLFLRKQFKWSITIFIWPFIFSLSRIYVGVHYPVDLIVGALVGIASAIGIYMLFNYVAKYRLDQKELQDPT
ncbi:phosphatase PAP2 family protein [Croceivirga lutea]|uniref:phosphatase PAP2 family protein n=1 Tax=Croceivirga lutea TaxID=1775167 RepID=UPI00163A10DE|nr:phosphatase PAP2 family protein [Croceivirga lutea]GGG52832.1 phosphatase PAP2 family protein [Croceivirga lutea]